MSVGYIQGRFRGKDQSSVVLSLSVFIKALRAPMPVYSLSALVLFLLLFALFCLLYVGLFVMKSCLLPPSDLI